MQPNQTREVQAAETIRLTVGNAGGVQLTLNGKDLGALGSEGEVKTVTLAARALQEVVP
jgi:cytoskeleton protein RodZ